MKQNDRMHIVQIITKLEMGGAQKVCLTIKRGLDNQNIWASLISGETGELAKAARNLPNSIFIKELKREVSLFGFVHEFICFFKLIHLLRKFKKQYPDLIVHTHSTKAGLIGRWAAFFALIKKRVHTIHGYGFQPEQNACIRFLIYSLELMTSFITTHYICVSTEDAKRGCRIFPRFAKKHSIIRAAIDWQEFYIPAQKLSTPTEKNEFVFGTIGGLSKRKNQIESLKAFEIVHALHPHTRLELVGDGDQRSLLTEWVKEHGLEYAITFHGWQHKVASIMADWHAFLLTSLWEGMPCVIVEARMLKLPVLCYETNGIRDIIIPGLNGFIYKQRDFESLAQGMCALIEDPVLYKSLALHAEDLSDFNDTQMVNQHIELYKSL
jgi:glycosyltransferase involved in cell wall biosynthesis